MKTTNLVRSKPTVRKKGHQPCALQANRAQKKPPTLCAPSQPCAKKATNLVHADLVPGHPGHGVPLTLPYSLAATSAILAPNPIV